MDTLNERVIRPCEAMHRLALVALAALLSAPVMGCDNPREPTQEEKDAKFTRELEDADARIRSNKPAEAAQLLTRLLEERPDHARATALLGKAHFAEGKYEDAEVLLQKAAAASPDDAHTHYLLGETLRFSDRFAEAADAYAKAWALDAENSDYGLSLGIAMIEAKKPAEAEKVLSEVVELDPKVQDGAKTGVHTHLGDALRAQEKLDDALRHYMKAQTINQSDKMAFAGAALVYEGKDDVKHALDQWSAYIQRDCCSQYSKTVAQKKITELEIPADDTADG